MKRIIAVILAALMLLAVTACGKTEPAQPADDAAPEVSVTGEWELDIEKCADIDLFAMFGSGLREYGSSLKLAEDGTIEYYIGIGVGGEGTYTFDGTTVNASVKGYNEGNDYTAVFTVAQEDGEVYLKQDIDDVTIWWERIYEENPNVDTNVELLVYQNIVDRYYDLLSAGSGAQELMDEGLNYMVADCGDPMNNVGYLEYDFDGDGIAELAIGSIGNTEFFKNMIFELYKLDEHDQPELVFTSGERNRYYYAGGSSFANQGSGGADDSFNTTYKYENGQLVDTAEITGEANYVQMELIPFSEWK